MKNRDRLVRRPAALAVLLVSAASCTSILDIDKQYVAGNTVLPAPSVDASRPSKSLDAGSGGKRQSGGTTSAGGTTSGAGGATESGGRAESGGATETGGSAGAVSDCTTTGCSEGHKCCGNPNVSVVGSTCYLPSPLVGCADTGCEYCSDPVPTHSTAACAAGKCSFSCDPGYMEQGGACVPMGTGGRGGAGGATSSGGGTGKGGSTSTTRCSRDSDCTVSCAQAGPFPCCMPNDTCGCTFFNFKLGQLPPIGYCLPRPPGF